MEKILNGLKARFGNRKGLAAVLVLLLLTVGTVGFVAARYIANYQKEAEIHASDFHFSSNYLQYNSTPEYSVSDWSTKGVNFLLYNHEQENTALISDTAIQYKIGVSDDWTVTVTDANGNAVQKAADGKYTLEASAVLSHHKVTLSYTGNGSPEDVAVSVTSTNPYSKALNAKFRLTTEKGFEYTSEDKGDYVVVTLQTNSYYGSVYVNYGSNFAPDNTNAYMRTWTGSQANAMTVQDFSVYELIFVKTSAAANKNQITVSSTNSN